MAMNTDEMLNEIMSKVDSGFKEQQADTYEKFSQDPHDRWTGKVIDNIDPEMLGRVKILVFGYYDELAEFALPWAVPDIGYIGGSNGSFVVPEVGTFVRGYFEDKGITNKRSCEIERLAIGCTGVKRTTEDVDEQQLEPSTHLNNAGNDTIKHGGEDDDRDKQGNK